MVIKKYKGTSEKEAMLKVKEELGSEALIVNIKTIKHKGIFRFIRRNSIEVTAAVDDERKHGIVDFDSKEKIASNRSSDYSYKTNNLNSIEEKLNQLQNYIEKNMNDERIHDDEKYQEKKAIIQLIYNQLIDNEVEEIVANKLLLEIEDIITDVRDVDSVITNVYNKIISSLGDVNPIKFNDKKPRIAFFIGPTGVGKTTTIAKIASQYVINEKKKVAFLTADTYRIAAVEQLRTYANILCIPLRVIYSVEEINDAIDEFSDYDLILIDTAGRSHKNEEQFEEMKTLINYIDDKEVFLVLSVTTKYKDLMKITKKYSFATDYKIIFTKLDETVSLGNILNIKVLTDAELSYATFGQNVPDDIEEINIQEIAKHLLGGQE